MHTAFSRDQVSWTDLRTPRTQQNPQSDTRSFVAEACKIYLQNKIVQAGTMNACVLAREGGKATARGFAEGALQTLSLFVT